MDEKRLRYIAAGCFILGMIVLTFVHTQMQEGNLNDLYEGKNVLFTGKVVAFQKHPGSSWFLVKGRDGAVAVTAFTSNISLQTGDYVSVQGTVQEVNNISVIAKKVAYIK